MNTRSRKAKGKRLEQSIVALLLSKFKELTDEDIRCTISSENGADVKLSKKAQKLVPLSIECKSRSQIAVYNWYMQAQGHEDKLEPIVFIKQNRKPILAIVNADYFLELLKK